MASHNQRGRGFLSIETDGETIVPLDKVINVLKDSMSARIYELLKRGDESYVVMAAHKNARFVEDCVREMARQVVANFADLPGETRVTLRQTNEESIHQHDAYAERDATLAELRNELNA
jgi:GTP cyclohydrolase-4